MRILIHPGFHKTGTTSVQSGLQRNAATLAPRLRVLLMEDFPRAITAARRHSADPAPKRLDAYAQALDAAFAKLDPKDARPVLVSSEKLLGWIPGRRDNWSYAAAPDFMARMVEVLEARFGGAAEITLFFTTRDPEAWMRSVYWQNLKVMRLTEEFESYRSRLAKAVPLDEVVEAVRRTLGSRPGLRVVSRPVEALREAPQGPLGAALDLLEIGCEGLLPFKSYNLQPEGAARALLDLNRSGMDDAALSAAKQALMQGYQQSGQTRSTSS
ncbi:MAG: hypothetical protein RIG84_14690 [Roseovarius sp.]